MKQDDETITDRLEIKMDDLPPRVTPAELEQMRDDVVEQLENAIFLLKGLGEEYDAQRLSQKAFIINTRDVLREAFAAVDTCFLVTKAQLVRQHMIQGKI